MATYLELYNKRKNLLELRYIEAVKAGDEKAITSTIREMIKMCSIDKNDERLDKKSVKIYSKYWEDAAKEIKKYSLDGNDRVPDNFLFPRIKGVPSVTITSEKHWMKRVELQYEGDIIADENHITYRIFEKNNMTAAIGCKRAMIELCKKLAKTEIDLDREKIECGGNRMFDISLENYRSFALRKLGYFEVMPVNNGVKIDLILDHEEMIRLCVDVKSTYDNVKDIIREAYKEIGVNNVRFVGAVNVDEVSKYQHSIARKEPVFNLELS